MTTTQTTLKGETMRLTLATASGKGFWKQIDGIDRDYSDGRSLDGEFLNGGRELDVTEGVFVVRRWAERRKTCVALYRTDSASTGDVYGRYAGLTQIGEAYDWDDQLLSFLDHCEASISGVDPRADAIAKIRQLMADHNISTDDLT